MPPKVPVTQENILIYILDQDVHKKNKGRYRSLKQNIIFNNNGVCDINEQVILIWMFS